MIRFDLLEPYARAVALSLGLGVLEAAALALLVAAAGGVSRTSATTRHVLWWIALAACAALPLAGVTGSFAHVHHQSAERVARSVHVSSARGADAGASREPIREERFPSARPGRRVPPAGEAAPRAAALAALTLAPPALGVPPVATLWSPLRGAVAGALRLPDELPYAATGLVALWLAVAAARWIRLAFGVAALGRIKRNALPLDDSVVRRLRRWRHSARSGRAVALAVSSDVDVPVAIGFRTPTILLPAAVVETQEIADIDQIAMHEYAHLERYDDWTNLLQHVLECALWFNPAVAFIGRRISLEREVACDDWVIAQTGRAHRYATCLWKLVESTRLPAAPVVAPGALLSPKEITVRIERLLDSRRNALPRLSPLAALGLGALAATCALLEAGHAPAIALTDTPCPRTAAQAAAHAPQAAAMAAPHVIPAAAPRPAAAVEPPRPAHPALAAAPARPSVPAKPGAAARLLAQSVAANAAHAAHGAHAAEPLPPLPPVPPLPPRGDLARAGAEVARDVSALANQRTLAALETSAEVAPLTDAQTRALEGIEGTVNRAMAGVARSAGPETRIALSDLDGTSPARLDRAGIAACSGCDLRGKDLRGLDLHGITLAGADLRGADLRDADLSGTNLTGDDLSGVRFDGANLSGATIEASDLNGASFVRANLAGLHLRATGIRHVVFRDTQLRSLIDGCMGCDLRGLDLRGQDLHGIRLDGADLRGADLRGTDLSDAHLNADDLRDAKLSGANFHNATFRACDLRRTDRSGADMSGASIDASDQ